MTFPAAAVSLAAVLVWALLNALLTLENVWPTLWARPAMALSLEAALVVLAVVWLTRRGPLSGRATAVLAAVVVAAALTRYAEVTVVALYGRPLNLYWDAEHIPRVAAMLAAAASPLRLALGALAVGAILAGVLFTARLGVRVLGVASERPRPRVLLVAAAAAVVAAHGAGLVVERSKAEAILAQPVASAWFRQAGLFAVALTGHDTAATDAGLPAPARLDALGDADVFLVFLESYGAATFTQPAHREALADARRELAAAVAETGRVAASAMVTSPTFGGASWLAHASVLAGRETRTPGAYNRLVNGRHETLVRALSRHGHRTVALMPGLRQSWPEGAVYGFDAIYGAAELDYRGPAFGWWRIPDQYALAKLDAEESAQRPLFVFFPTITSHAPFRPVPPLQHDWRRLAGDTPYGADMRPAPASDADWEDLGPAYVAAIGYTLRTVAGYLRHRADRDLVVVLLGDHQPPGGVAGERASWDVPVHVIANRAALLDPLRAHGFAAGLAPGAQSIGPMHGLAAMLLEAFGSGGVETRVVARTGGDAQAGVHVPGAAAARALAQ